MTRQRLAKTTTRLSNGTSVTRTTIKPRAVQEWEIQAEAVRRLRAMPEFDRQFTLAGDMAAAKRSRQGSVIAKATGLVPGDPDLRIYLTGGRLCMIEFKAGKGRESTEQVDRIALLDTLGFTVEVVKAETADEGATRTVELVRKWLDQKIQMVHVGGIVRGSGKPWLLGEVPSSYPAPPQINSEAGRAAVSAPWATVAANDNNRAQVAALGRIAK